MQHPLVLSTENDRTESANIQSPPPASPADATAPQQFDNNINAQFAASPIPEYLAMVAAAATPDANKQQDYFEFNTVGNGRWKVTGMIGAGSFGQVFAAVDLDSGANVAIKRELTDGPRQDLRHEYSAYQYLKRVEGFPRIYHFGTEGPYNVLVMERLGKSLKQLARENLSRKIPLRTIIRLVPQFLRRLQSLHEVGIVFRDVKPDQFCIGRFGQNIHDRPTVFLIDFGLASSYLDSEGKHISRLKPDKNKAKTGSARYASLNVHKGKTHSRRDDLESLAYTLVEAVKGSLPWANVTAASSIDGWRQIGILKADTSVSDLCEGIPQEFGFLLEYARGLHFSDAPDYGMLVGMFAKLIVDIDENYSQNQDHALIGRAAKIPTLLAVPVVSVSPVTLDAPGRAVPLQLKVSAPFAALSSDSSAELLPIILLSHGHGQSNFLSSLHGYAPLADFWASRGFVVVQPTHLNSKSLSVKSADAPMFWRSRVQDLKLILDNLDAIEAFLPHLRGRLDRDRIAVAGHSIGGHTANLLLGMQLVDEEGINVNFFEPRIKAGIVLAAPGNGGDDLTPFAFEKIKFFRNSSFSEMTTPALVVIGDKDVSPHLTARGFDWHADAFTLSPGPKSLLTLFDADHYLGGISGFDAVETSDENVERAGLVQRLTWAYLRSTLYPDDPAWTIARAALDETGLGKVESK
ncbi:hypothetical protein HK100_007705 [Physocladia obscura]|uniref:Protein kinase domain-containing protein n=1 Tax=Physocladia obscura TaxID=109957 RepID=A0AAD5T563_9FUNG|nr:hypothetical protein HK100_007705 [Physocladia obscura]